MHRPAYKIMIVAGEASGDLHAAKLVSAFREIASDAELEFFGAAGERMRAAGVDPVVRADDLSIVGLLEIGRALPMFLRTFSSLKRAAADRKPDAVVLVDFPDFNLKLAKSLSKLGIKVVYYISPQLWAWRGYRIRSIRKYVDLVISILPFEKDWYAARGVDHVEYVGSPLAREVHTTESKHDFVRRHSLDPERPIVALLPGSRHKEIVRILPVMLGTASQMSLARSDIQFVVAVASEKNSQDVDWVLRGQQVDSSLSLAVVTGETFNALGAADAAAVTSGTATLETGIIGTPLAIVYKTSSVNYKLLRPLIDVEHFGLINLIAGERVAAELIQDDFTPTTLSEELFVLLDPVENTLRRERLQAAALKLGRGGASKRAAESILKLMTTPADSK
ncbi:MAG TPA: lipid-A-disaccharide synthase [Pyrinomonadaceae bacterium]|nr:lipid-A-disaccharide synthase [Pyrinomonadaceae bacterium]